MALKMPEHFIAVPLLGATTVPGYLGTPGVLIHLHISEESHRAIESSPDLGLALELEIQESRKFAHEILRVADLAEAANRGN